jgi:hypothetical protein
LNLFNNLDSHFFPTIINEIFDFKIGIIARDNYEIIPDFIMFFCFLDEFNEFVIDLNGVHEFKKYKDEILNNNKDYYIISCNGEMIRNLQKNNILSNIPKNIKKDLIEEAKKILLSYENILK